jgi:4-hydroxy 2-oxovalerate aldolase
VRKFYDVTLRDGNHALRHQLSMNFLINYCEMAQKSQSWAVEVGHGNGLGASSYLIGKSLLSDEELLRAARMHLGGKLLAVHAIPGIATIERDLKPALDLGVDVFRVATHATEASLAERHIEFLATKNIIVHGVLMMSHMNSIDGLVEQARMMSEFGASAVVLMDSAGHFRPDDVKIRVQALREQLGVEVGFHAHNNFGLAVANACIAEQFGASVLDGAAMGLGAGSGNAQLEALVTALYSESVPNWELEPFYNLSDLTAVECYERLPKTTSSSLRSGLAGAFSGFAPQVQRLSDELGISVDVLWSEIGKRKIVAGQESILREIAIDLMNL